VSERQRENLARRYVEAAGSLRGFAELSTESGFEVTELFGGERGEEGGFRGSKYRNPKDASQTWMRT
jgi:hypothetical protein